MLKVELSEAKEQLARYKTQATPIDATPPLIEFDTPATTLSSTENDPVSIASQCLFYGLILLCNVLLDRRLTQYLTLCPLTGDTAAGPADTGALGKAGPRNAHRGFSGSEDSHSPGDTHAHSRHGEM